MSLEQKVGQMVQAERMRADPEEAAAYHLGSLLSGGGSCPGANRTSDWVAMADSYWEAYQRDHGAGGRNGRPVVPPIYGVDAIHGHNNVLGATVFPHNVGMGAAVMGQAGRSRLVEEAMQATAREVLATGVDWSFAPCLAVALDPRWGRTYESYSSDPEVVAACGTAAVRGLQDGAGPFLGPRGIVACAKHWVGDGGTEKGIDQGDTLASESELMAVHVRPYHAALETGALTVMVSLSSWQGELCHGHEGLVSGLLKGDLGFSGVVVSDWNGIDRLSPYYGEAVVQAVTAGIDLFMVPDEWRRFLHELLDAVRTGRVPLSRIDDAAGRVLALKEKAGLLDAPRPGDRPGVREALFGTEAHRRLARRCVRKSAVLLKRGEALPLDPAARILVVGRAADDVGVQCGGFTIEWQGVRGNDLFPTGRSVWQEIRSVAPCAFYAPERSALPPAEGFDVAVAVIGEAPYAEGLGDIRTRRPEGCVSGVDAPVAGPGALDPYGDSLELARLHPEQLELLRAVADMGLPLVVVLLSGRPLVIGPELDLSDAFVSAWLPGTEGGGVADLLFGKSDFEGRLPFEWPADDSPNGGTPALFPRGYGLRLSR